MRGGGGGGGEGQHNISDKSRIKLVKEYLLQQSNCLITELMQHWQCIIQSRQRKSVCSCKVLKYSQQLINYHFEQWCCGEGRGPIRHRCALSNQKELVLREMPVPAVLLSLSELPPRVLPLQSPYPRRESGSACWCCHLLHRYLPLLLTVLLYHRVLICS